MMAYSMKTLITNCFTICDHAQPGQSPVRLCPFGKQPSFHRFENWPGYGKLAWPLALPTRRIRQRCPNFIHSCPQIDESVPRPEHCVSVAPNYRLASCTNDRPSKNPKKVVVKAGRFPYFFLQMHRVGAGVNGFYPENACTGKVQQTTN